MIPALVRVAAWALAAMTSMSALTAPPARADTPIAEYKSFRGTVNFTGTTETLRFKDKNLPCKLVKEKFLSATLGGLPAGATVLSAQLYWAGSGAAPDYEITFDGVNRVAEPRRRFTSTRGSGASAMSYFGAVADVTDQIRKKGNGNYSFSGLDIDNGDPYCAAQTVVGGFALLVVYSHPNEPYRKLNVYEGFQAFQNSSIKIDLTGFTVPSPLPAGATGRVGHITWEGDGTLAQGGESLLFNGVELTDDLNPSGNQFNSKSNITGDSKSYGIDFDTYVLRDPVIKAGDTSATTVYQSGQDLVLLSAEVLAMPYMSTVDLALEMTRSGDLTVGGQVAYTIRVTNQGPDTESGPVTVVDTLPKGMSLVSAGGSNWSCASVVAASGETVVTCSQNGPLESGAGLNPLVVTVSPTVSGNLSNNATVTGKLADARPGNNSASDTANIGAGTAVPYVFTRTACANGQAIAAGEGDSGCRRFTGPVTAGAPTQVYLTAVAGSPPKASALDLAADKKVALQFNLACAPNSGVKASYAGATLDCDGAWSASRDIGFAAGNPSAALSFAYADVGRLTLGVKSASGAATTPAFVSRPASVAFTRVLRKDGYPNVDTELAFARAGEDFELRLGALMANEALAPSFGKEGVLGSEALPKVALAFPSEEDKAALEAVDDFGGAAAEPGGGQVRVGTFHWLEAGKTTITPSLPDYLGAGAVAGSARVIGRFYPDHFTTTVREQFACPAPLACPSGGIAGGRFVPGVNGAAYSGYPFRVSVAAFGLPARGRTEPTLLGRIENTSARRIDLSFYDAQANTVAPSAARLPQSSAQQPFPALSQDVAYTLPQPYVAGATSGSWSAPRAVHLRATLADVRGRLDAGGNPGTEAITISSANPNASAADAATAAATQYEQGLSIVAGRLLVPNLFGSELLRLPVSLSAQYWSGSAWRLNDKDNDSSVAAGLESRKCTKFFAAADGACKPDALVLATPGAVELAGGKARVWVKSPGRGQVGSVDYRAQNPGAPWLPSTQARATFGLYASPLIYVREVY